MADFIKKAVEDEDINNGAAVVSGKQNGTKASTTDFVTDAGSNSIAKLDSPLSARSQADNESKLEDRFGNRFKYFNSGEEIKRIQSKGGGVNKTLSQVQSRLSDVKKEKSETVVTKAEENKDFNSGGAVSNAGGGSKFSDTLETNLSKKDQSDTAAIINDKIGKSVQTGSNSGSQDATAIREEIINNDQAIANADASTDSDGLDVGGCPDAKTRGGSRFFGSIFSLSLSDRYGENALPAVSVFWGNGPCDCLVPINLPLLSTLTKLAKAPNRMSKALRQMFSTNPFKGLLTMTGYWPRYYTKATRALNNMPSPYGTYKNIGEFLRYGPKLISKTRRAKKKSLSWIKGFQNRIDGHLVTIRAAAKRKVDAQAALALNPTAAKQIQLEAIIKQADAAITHKNTLIAELQGEITDLHDFMQNADKIIKEAQDALTAAQKTYNKKKLEIALGDVFGVLDISFDALAALDPTRTKICVGPGTVRNEETCECDCQPGYTECGTGPAPEIGIPDYASMPLSYVWDFLAPWQSSELKRCYPPCPCNMVRTTGGLVGSNCECTECKDGYTWYAGATCECERTTGYDGTNVVTRKTEIGTCVQNEKVTSNTSMGKTWDSKGCGWKCGPDTDVGNKDRPFGTHHRLNDNYPTVAPSKHHILYAQGCTYVCDGRDRPEGDPWPPVCPGGFFNTEKCECAPTNCPQYMGHNALVLQNVSYGLDPDTGEPTDYDNFWSVYETRRGGSTSLVLPAGATVTPPGGGQDYGLYIDSAGANGYEFSADPRRYVEWSSSRVRYKAFECDQDGTLGSDITGSVIDLTGVTGPLESCVQETYGENPRDPPVVSETDTWLGCLSLNYGVAGVSSVDPDIIP